MAARTLLGDQGVGAAAARASLRFLRRLSSLRERARSSDQAAAPSSSCRASSLLLPVSGEAGTRRGDGRPGDVRLGDGTRLSYACRSSGRPSSSGSSRGGIEALDALRLSTELPGEAPGEAPGETRLGDGAGAAAPAAAAASGATGSRR